MSHFTLRSGVAEEVLTCSYPICPKRYPCNRSDGLATIGCEDASHLQMYEEKIWHAALQIDHHSHSLRHFFDRAHHTLYLDVATYFAAHPQEDPHEHCQA